MSSCSLHLRQIGLYSSPFSPHSKFPPQETHSNVAGPYMPQEKHHQATSGGAVRDDLESNEFSCLDCHDLAHGIQELGEMDMWEGAAE